MAFLSDEQYITIAPITSLADLEFKAKTDKNYEQLAVIACKYITYGESRIKTFKNAIKKLHLLASTSFDGTCAGTVRSINQNCHRIKVTKQESVCQLVKTNQAQKVVDKLKKLKRPARPAVRRLPRRVV